MPKRYISIREELKKKGLTDKRAKEKAAKIYNATRKPNEKPVTRRSK